MDFLLVNFIYFLVAFVLVFLFYYFFVIRKVKKNKDIIPMELNFFIRRYNLNIKKINKEKVVLLISLTNSFIISFTSVVTFNVESLLWRLVIGFALLMTLIYSLYEIEGGILKRKENKK